VILPPQSRCSHPETCLHQACCLLSLSYLADKDDDLYGHVDRAPRDDRTKCVLIETLDRSTGILYSQLRRPFHIRIPQ
jgi:hypothetical protein